MNNTDSICLADSTKLGPPSTLCGKDLFTTRFLYRVSFDNDVRFWINQGMCEQCITDPEIQILILSTVGHNENK